MALKIVSIAKILPNPNWVPDDFKKISLAFFYGDQSLKQLASSVVELVFFLVA